ncbi:MAG TPA: ATP-binding protein, partial [Gemmatimonadales bacterium]|nr:ATP-binding protein [Gemmatimonadales bacterium]
MPTLAERFLQRLERRRLLAGPATALVAVSGGADSVALLDLLAGVASDRRVQLIVAHADHGI